jgi:hypothetical protein
MAEQHEQALAAGYFSIKSLTGLETQRDISGRPKLL